MSVVSAKQIHDSTNGTFTKRARSQSVVYRVQTDDPQDGPNTVVSSSSLPSLGSYYSFGGESDTVSRLTRKVARRTSNRLVWTVECQYETPGSKSGSPSGKQRYDENGEEVENPLDEFRRVSVRSTKLTLPVEEAELLSAGFPGRAQNTFGPVTNSAGQPFNPPLTQEVPITVITLTDNREEWPEALAEAEGKVNSDFFSIIRKGYAPLFVPHDCMCDSVSGSLMFEAGVFFWEVEIVILYNPLKWRTQVLDRGFLHNAEEGDPDGEGGTVTEGDILAGAAPLRGAADNFGVPYSEPILLDGQGNALERGAEPVFLEYRVYEETPFTPLAQ